MGLKGSDGESLIDTLMDLSNYANMAIIELTSTPGGDEGQTTEVPKKKRKKKAKEETKEEKEEAPKEKGPLDDLTKKQLIEVISQLGGTIPKKANREKLTGVIAGFPKAKVAVAITSMKPTTETAEGKDGDGKEGEE